MTTLQEYLDNKYPTKKDKERVKEIIFVRNSDHKVKVNIHEWSFDRKTDPLINELDGKDLNLANYPNLERIEIDGYYLKSKLTRLELGNKPKLVVLDCQYNELTSLNLANCPNLERIYCWENQLTNLILGNYPNLEWIVCSNNELTNLDFLNQLSVLGKLKKIELYNNNIQPTDIAIFSRFVNLRALQLGVTSGDLGKHNRFFGSFESWKNLTKLEGICIEATDVDSGLEYLPFSLARATKGGRYARIECSPHDTDAKCSAIQNELRPFNYDLEAWQLAHPEKMLVSRPEYFTNPDSRDEWLGALSNKIKESKETLAHITQNETDKVKKIERLESQIKNLEKIQNQINQEKNFLLREKNELQAKNQELDEENKRLEAKVEELEKIISSVREQLNQVQITEQVAQIQVNPFGK